MEGTDKNGNGRMEDIELREWRVTFTANGNRQIEVENFSK